MPGSPASGRLQGLKAASLYIGETEWVRRQLAAKAASLLGPLDRVDQLQDAGDIENSAQIKNAIISFSTTGIPNHWLRCQRPTYTRVVTSIANADGTRNTSMTETFDERSAQCFELLLDAHFSPADRRARAVQQARLQSKIGGHEILNTDAIAEPAHTSSFLACFPRMRQWFPNPHIRR